MFNFLAYSWQPQQRVFICLDFGGGVKLLKFFFEGKEINLFGLVEKFDNWNGRGGVSTT